MSRKLVNITGLFFVFFSFLAVQFLLAEDNYGLEKTNVIRFSSKGSQLASDFVDMTIKFWDVETGALIRTLKEHKGVISRIGYSPNDELLISTSRNNTVNLWDAKTGQSDVVISPNGKLYASGKYESIIRVRELSTNNFLYMFFAGHPSIFTQLDFSLDNRYLATASTSNGDITIWDIATGKQVNVFASLGGSVRDLTFNSKGTYIASLSSNHVINIWNILSGTRTGLNEKMDEVEAIAFNADGTKLAIVYHNEKH